MTESRSSKNTAAALIRRARAALAQAIPRLSFEQPLESQFRLWYAEHSRSRIRNAMWFAMGNIIVVLLAGGPFRAMRDEIFGAGNHFILDVLRFGVIAPSAAALLIVSYTNLYWRWFRLTAQIVAPLMRWRSLRWIF